MKIIAYNIVSICFLALAAWILYLDRDGWGWCIFGAIISAVTVTTKTTTNEKT